MSPLPLPPNRVLALPALAISLAVACGSGGAAGGSQPAYQLVTLSSGRQLKVLGEARMNFPNSGPALMLRYQTDVPLTDTAALRTQAADIWRDYQPHADSTDVRGVILSANAAPQGGFVSQNAGYNFVYEKGADGRWNRVR